MRVSPPKIYKEEKFTTLWSKISLAKNIDGFPEYLWYRVPAKYSQHLSTHSNAFLVASIIPAMLFGEPIHVQGTISPQLAYHLDEYIFLTRILFPDKFQPIKITYDNLSILETKTTAVGSTFSGGADSFFTLFKHSRQTQVSPEYQVSHALFINGIDITRQDEKSYQNLRQNYQIMLGQQGIELIPVETNQVNMLIPWLKYSWFYSPALISSAMVLDGLFRRIIVSNSYDYRQLKIRHHNSNPLSDRLLSTETLDVAHFGANYRRTEKLETIHNWTQVQENLRVCGTPNKNEEINCCRCEKCVRTMISLYALGSLKNFTTFKKPLTSRWHLLRWARKFNYEHLYVYENYLLIKKYKPRELPWFYAAVLLGFLRYWAIRLIPQIIKRNLQPFGYFIDPLKDENAFEDPALISALGALWNQQVD